VTDILNINNLCVNLQGKNILSDVELILAKGDILGLVGPSGCGKTTLLNTIAGFIEQEKGNIVIDDTITITPKKTVAPQNRNIGMIFQDYALFPHLTVEQNICFGITKLTKKEQQSRLHKLVKLLELSDLEKRFPHQLSGGQQQRVAIARALAPQPKLLLLDEPFSNIDARLRNELITSMRALLKSLKITAIFVTHNKDEVFSFADTISVMHQGTILQTGTPANVCQKPVNWQVADFLQLGSWIPLKIQSSMLYQTALGELSFTERQPDTIKVKPNAIKEHQAQQLLLKPYNIEVSSTAIANVQVNNIVITEQGYHYLFSSLIPNTELTFEQLSYYSNEPYSLGQHIALTIKSHDFLIFNKPIPSLN
jgi:iron(III) transport system ATP-binding protein